MIHEPSGLAVAIFFAFIAFTLGLSFWLGRSAKSSEGYFAAHGQIPWFVNGVAFAGDYLSAASFLGICGMIAFYGYDGFLYSIGFLAGWVVALFVVAEPMKRLGKFTFADALNAKFQSPGVKIAAGLSTLAVSVFYLIPQMVGAGVLVQPLLGLEHWQGVLLVGVVVILIVVTAGMVSTTWVQFLKGGLLVVFSAVLVVMILQRGFTTSQSEATQLVTLGPIEGELPEAALAMPEFAQARVFDHGGGWREKGLLHFLHHDPVGGDSISIWSIRRTDSGETYLDQAQAVFELKGTRPSPAIEIPLIDVEWVTGVKRGVVPYRERATLGGSMQAAKGSSPLLPVGRISRLPGGVESTGPLGPIKFFRTLHESEVVLWGSHKIPEADGTTTTVYYQKPTPGAEVLRPGEHPKFAGIRQAGREGLVGKLNFLSLMLALFCGTASLPHILIRYYTVKDGAAARKSTIVGIACIGFFYVLTLYIGLGAMTSGALDVTQSNMAAPLLARSLSEPLFAIISAIAFTTVLGTVSGLILASAGAVVHDLYENLAGAELTDHGRVRLARIASVIVGGVAIGLGVLFQGLNVGYLVGWAFSVAASANLPALVMLLFWKPTTKQGVIAGIVVGMVSSLGWILLSADTYSQVYGLPAADAPMPFSQPGLVTIPLSFFTLVVVSLLTREKSAVGGGQ